MLKFSTPTSKNCSKFGIAQNLAHNGAHSQHPGKSRVVTIATVTFFTIFIHVLCVVYHYKLKRLSYIELPNWWTFSLSNLIVASSEENITDPGFFTSSSCNTVDLTFFILPLCAAARDAELGDMTTLFLYCVNVLSII